jgi:hypothetical protein
VASLAQQPALALQIDHVLAVLTRQWLAIPEVVATWATWDELDRLDFVLEWPLREIKLHQLEAWVAEGHLTAAQREQFTELRQLIQRHRPTLERLLAE